MNDVTHLGIYDIPMISNIPNIVYLAPTSKAEYFAMLDWSIEQNEHPVAIRIPCNGVVTDNRTVDKDYSELNKYKVEKEGSKIAIIALGDFYQLGEKVEKEILEKLNLLSNQLSYSSNYRSPERVGKNVKRHFADPSLAAALLNMNSSKLIDDLKTFGFLFEALVERDLKIYMDYLGGNLYHFRDNVNGLEVDSILEFENGEYAAVEIKLGFNQYKEACESLLKFQNNVTKKPKFMCVICGYNENIVKDKETGIYIIPITALKPE